MITKIGNKVHPQDLTLMRRIKQVMVTSLREKLKMLYLHYRSAYGNQTWQDYNLSEWVPFHKKSQEPLI